MAHRINGKIYRLAVLPFLLLLLTAPVLTYAEAALISAGFAPQSIWISRSHVAAGDSVNIFTVLYNSSESPIGGEVIFTVDNATIGTKEFTLKSGESQIVSLPWSAKAGSHSISARIEKSLITDTNADAGMLNKATGNITVNVEDSPPPSLTVQVLSSAASAVASGVASSAPIVVSAFTSIYDKTEVFRAEAKSALEKQIAESSVEATAAGASSALSGDGSAAKGQANGSVSSSSATENEPPFLSTAGRYAALAGLAIVNSKTLFYVSLALVLLLLIQILRVSLRERRKTY